MFIIESWAISTFIQVILIVVSQTHWMTLKIDLKDWTIYIFDFIVDRNKDKGWTKERNMMPFKAFLLYLIQQAGYFEQVGLQPRMDIFKVVLVHGEQSAKQIDDDSCGMFCLSFIDSIIRGLPIFNRITQAFVDKLKKDYVFEIFLNSTDLVEVVESE